MRIAQPQFISRRFSRGVTMLEAIFLLTIVSIVAVAVGISLQALAAGPNTNDEQQAVATELMSELEVWRNTPFTTLATYATATGTTTTDTVTINVAGTTKSYTRKTYIKRLDPTDPTNNTTPQADFTSIQVSIGPRTATVWVTQP